MNPKRFALLIPLTLLWLLLGSPGVARADDLTVCPDGPPTCDYDVIQDAVDAAAPGDVVKVATGVYTDLGSYDGLIQVVYISKTVTLRGGYTTDFVEPPDPETNPTILDAGGQGRVLYINGLSISPIIEGLHLTGGDTTGLYVSGGGVYVNNATATLRGNTIRANRAYSGAGVYLSHSDSLLLDNTITQNDVGGGLVLHYSEASLLGNTISANHAISMAGGVALLWSDATLEGNVISANSADWAGGGVFLAESNASLNGNIIASNVVSWSHGGGVLIEGPGAPRLTNNLIVDNQCSSAGAGLYVTEGAAPRMWHNTLARNSGGDGNGIYVTDQHGLYSSIWLTNTVLLSHTTGVEVSAGNAAYLEGTLWGNGTDWTGAGTIVTGSLNLWGDPAFLDPAAGDYHIRPGSVARDQGISTLVLTDVDYQPRDAQPDLGADEYVDATCCYARLNDGAIYTTVQAAVDASSQPGDLIKVAGYCTGTLTRPSPPGYQGPATISQVVYLSRSLSLQGGYTLTNWFDPDPEAHPSTLDAQGTGRVLFVEDGVQLRLEGLRLVGGDAAGLGGASVTDDGGGGVYVSANAGVEVDGCHILSNTADSGGGLYANGSVVSLTHNLVSGNTTYRSGGGGLCLVDGDAWLADNTIANNGAFPGSMPSGGGLYLVGGGRTALAGNRLVSNTARFGGGVCVYGSDAVTLTGNYILSNTASASGGGVLLNNSDATLEGNTLLHNLSERGGGVDVNLGAPRLINNVVADNRVSTHGGGLYVLSASPRLWHNTLARNGGGDGTGVYVDWTPGRQQDPTAWLTNTVLVSHTVGVFVSMTGTASLEATLWGNDTDWAGPGTIVTGSHNYWGDPAFTDPAAGDYHIGLASAGLDRGVPTSVLSDIDGDFRPIGPAPDLGADELPAALQITKMASSSLVQAGERLTYTLRLSNTGNVDLSATVTDRLPAHVSPGGLLVWSPILLAPGDVWTETVVVTVDLGYAGPLVNVAQATSLQGASGAYTQTTQAQTTPALSLTKEASPDPVQAGRRLTYSLRLSNTGNLTLTATLTDLLPDPVTPGGSLVWPNVVLAPAQSWAETVVVTVDLGYSGALTNRLEATSLEGVAAVYTATTGSITPSLALSKRAYPDPVQAGQTLVYSLRLTNTSQAEFVATVTDRLPERVSPAGTLTWTNVALGPGQSWSATVPVTVKLGYAGPLVNVMRVISPEGIAGVYTETSEAQVSPSLSLNKSARPNPVQAGQRLTYSLRLTNTGNVTLTALITDRPWLPGGPFTWTAAIPPAGGVWTETLALTIPLSYVGPLTNLLRARTQEGAWGSYTQTTDVLLAPPSAPVLLAPPDGTLTDTSLVTLGWQAGTGASVDGYQLDLNGTVLTTSRTSRATILPLGAYTWTLRAFNDAGLSAWAEPWTFQVAEYLPPETPTLLQPPDGYRTTVPTVTLSWEPAGSEPVDGYNLSLDGAVVTTTAPSWVAVLPLGVHTWTVRAFNDLGYAAWAEARSLEVMEAPPSYAAYLPVVIKNQ